MIIAIDGAAASGKGTLSKFLAEYYKCEWLPTGNLYRVIAKYLIDKEIDLDQFINGSLKLDLLAVLEKADILNTKLNNNIISDIASKIAKVKTVRKVLTKFQKQWIQKRKTAVVEGRDIGTVVYPNADVKLFLVANPNIRAKRRVQQLQTNGNLVSEEEIYSQLIKRDQRDYMRETAPMKMAKDAILIDTTNLTIKEMQSKAIELITSIMN
ncbi:MAG: (d)CMP kinase [Rickettsiales bacterium]|nr:(d)CMP kinase [Rickettsiales bacterium]